MNLRPTTIPNDMVWMSQDVAENLLILKSNKPLVDRYIQNFEAHKGHSVGYGGR